MNFVRGVYRLSLKFTKNSARGTESICKVSAACYSVKAQWRRPAKIYNHDGETEISDSEIPITRRSGKKDKIQGVIELEKDFSKYEARGNKKLVDSDISREDENESYSEEEDPSIAGTPYYRLGDTDRTFELRIFKVQSKKQRDKSKMIMLEGKRLIQDAISAGIIPTEIFFTKRSLVENLTMPPEEIKLYKMSYNKMKKWSPLDTPPGIVAFCEKPKMLKQPKNTLPLTLICDNVREPGNLGTILRTVAGVGCSKVILTKGCVDVWDPKVLRSAAGAHFYVPVKSDLTWEEINSTLEKNCSFFIAHHNAKSETDAFHRVPTIPYYSVNYSSLSDIVVVVGGETEGISDYAIELATYRDGVKINIPLNNHIDSLNVGAAVSTILFEVKRQFSMNFKDYSYGSNTSYDKN